MAEPYFATDDEDLRPPPTADDEARMAARNARYGAARGAALDLQAIRERNARSDMPAGSPTQYLDTNRNPLGPVQRDEFNIPKPAPLAATGLRGYPGVDEIRSSILANNAQDAADRFGSDVNSAIGRYPAAPKFQMPTTDQLIDTGIQARRSQLENEINTRKVHLGLLPPSAIGASAVTLDSEQPSVAGVGRHGQVRYGGSKADQTRAELAFLGRAAGQLDEAQQSNIRNNAALAIASAKQNDIAAQDTARAQVVHFMSNIDDSRYPMGSPDREAFIGKVFGNRPDWLHVMAKDKDLSKFVEDHVDAHKSVAETMAALKGQYEKPKITTRLSDKGAVSYSVTEGAKDLGNQSIPAAVVAKHAKLVGDVKYHTEESAKEEALNRAKPDAAGANTPYSKAPALHAATSELELLRQAYPKLGAASNVTQIPKSAMDALREDPSRAVDFDRKYGKGRAAIILH